MEPLGHAMRRHFPFDDRYLNLNTASYGVVPLYCSKKRAAHLADSAAAPDLFIRHEQIAALNVARALVAEQVGAPLGTVVLTPNATMGIHTVLHNLALGAHDVLISFSISYGACQKIIAATCETKGCKSHIIQLALPLSDDEIVATLADAIAAIRRQGLTPRLALLDTMSSLPGIRYPYERMVQLCRQEGVLSLVDGAHGYGQMPLNLAELDPDFFVSNCHKWGFVPLPVALLYVPARYQAVMRMTLPVSHYFVPADVDESFNNPLPGMSPGDTPFTKLYESVGTADRTAFLCVQAALEFRRDVCGGEERIQQYRLELARAAAPRVAELLGTEVLDNAEHTLTQCSVFNVRLPIGGGGSDLQVDMSPGFPAIAQWLQRETFKHKTFIPCFGYGGKLWARLSAEIFLELSDFEYGAQVLLEVCRKAAAGEHLGRAT